jgi:2-iminoacetate synthase ThiH
MIEDYLHLKVPVSPRAMCIEMNRHRAKLARRVRNVREQSPKVAEFIVPGLKP